MLVSVVTFETHLLRHGLSCYRRSELLAKTIIGSLLTVNPSCQPGLQKYPFGDLCMKMLCHLVVTVSKFVAGICGGDDGRKRTSFSKTAVVSLLARSWI
jgi:hypothetical protein